MLTAQAPFECGGKGAALTRRLKYEKPVGAIHEPRLLIHDGPGISAHNLPEKSRPRIINE